MMRKPSGPLLALCVTALLTACTLEPRYERPAPPVPNEWPIPATTAAIAEDSISGSATQALAAGAGTPALTAADIGWRDFFVDTKLQQLIALALANNRDLRVAVLNVQLAQAQYRVQRASLLPALNANAEYAKQKLPGAETGFPGTITNSYWEVGAGVTSYELDLFGKVRSQTKAALQQYFAQQEARRSAQLSLIAQVADAYLTLASDQELVRLSRDTLKSQQDSYDLTVKRHDTGAVSGLDLVQAQSTVEQARADLARYEGSVAQDIDALALLIGAALEPALLPENFDAKTMGVEALPAQLPSIVLLRRPDVLQAEHTLRSYNANIGAARAAFFPTIDLTASIGTVSPALSGLFHAGTQSWSFTPQATLPIFQGGALIGNLSAAHAQHDIALAQYEKAIQTGFREVADALTLTGTLERQQQAQQALVQATGKAYELSQQRYKNGSDSFLDVLTNQRSYYAAQQGLVATRLAEQSNRIALYKALGGGWHEHSAPVAQR